MMGNVSASCRGAAMPNPAARLTFHSIEWDEPAVKRLQKA